MTREECCELVCGCLETIGTFPGGCTCDTPLPELTDEKEEQLVACIVTKGQERGCVIILGPENINEGMTVDDLCDVIEAGAICD